MFAAVRISIKAKFNQLIGGWLDIMLVFGRPVAICGEPRD